MNKYGITLPSRDFRLMRGITLEGLQGYHQPTLRGGQGCITSLQKKKKGQNSISIYPPISNRVNKFILNASTKYPLETAVTMRIVTATVAPRVSVNVNATANVSAIAIVIAPVTVITAAVDVSIPVTSLVTVTTATATLGPIIRVIREMVDPPVID